MNDVVRTDSWAAALNDEQAWALYEKSLQPGVWTKVAAWAVKEFGLERMPSQAAFYRWKRIMRRNQHQHHMEEAAIAAAEAAALGRKVSKDETIANAFKALATEIAFKNGSAKEANYWINASVAISTKIAKEREVALREAELEIRKSADERKDRELALAREKFEAAEKRLNAASKAVADETMTDEMRVAKIKSIFGIQ